MTIEQIVKESKSWPREQLAQLVDDLTLDLHQRLEPELEEAWRQETRRRVVEIQSAQIAGIAGDEVARRIREIVGR
jgi:hypothetical protein